MVIQRIEVVDYAHRIVAVEALQPEDGRMKEQRNAGEKLIHSQAQKNKIPNETHYPGQKEKKIIL
jgi:hypothetical protein